MKLIIYEIFRILMKCFFNLNFFIYFFIAYPCRSSGIESSINAVFNRLNPPMLKLIPPLKGWVFVLDNPCRSKVPNGFFVLTDFTSFKFNVKFWRNRPPPVHMMKKRDKKRNVKRRRRRWRISKSLLFHLVNWMKIAWEIAL
jgi:hypothetical protein